MKKMIAIVMCVLMLMGAAVAEQEMQAWSIAVDEITVTKDGETVVLTPTLLVQTGMDAAGCWAQISALLDGEAMLTGQVEYVGDTLFASVDGAKDALLVEGAELFLNTYELTGAQVKAMVNALFNMMATGSDAPADSVAPETTGFDMQMTGENQAKIVLDKDGVAVSARLTWESHANELPYDLSEKNVCRYTFREMFPGDGTDIPEVVNAAMARLSEDDSVRALMELLSGVAEM